MENALSSLKGNLTAQNAAAGNRNIFKCHKNPPSMRLALLEILFDWR